MLRRRTAGLAALLLLAGGLAGCSEDGPEGAVQAFLQGWRSGDLKDVGFVTAGGGRIAAADVAEQIKQASGDLAQQPPTVTAQGEPKTNGDVATTTIKIDWPLPGGATWSYQSAVRATEAKSDGWQVIWEPAILHADLEQGDKLRVRRVPAKRGSILDGAGRPLIAPLPVVTVAIDPTRVDDAAGLTKKVAAALAKVGVTIDQARLRDQITTAKPGARVDVVTLRRPAYESIRDQIRPLPGTLFPESTQDLAPTRAFARALLGTVDIATAEDIEKRPAELAINDLVGHGGLQEKYDAALRGKPGVTVLIAKQAAEESAEPQQVFSAEPVAGKSIKVSLDVATQNAADQALAAEKQPSSMVAIRVSDGSVLAVANGPDGGGVNTALTGQVPPGSVMKMVSAYGLLSGGAVTADTVVECPKTIPVAGATFKNSHDQALGKVPFRVNFAKSCNTAFAALAPKLGAAGLQRAGAALGLGGNWNVGVDAYTGKVSDGAGATELAAATFGQGTTVVSPIAMAAATAAVARGQFQPPKLVLDPAPEQPGAAGEQLDQKAVTELRAMMREVVTVGTGTALRRTPGKPVHGKTGTAEFQTGSAQTHSWFVGYQGDVAFAVMVQKGGAGSEAAVPIAARFLAALNR